MALVCTSVALMDFAGDSAKIERKVEATRWELGRNGSLLR